MSTTGNEYEEPGVNYPDRKDADGATDTPKQGEPTRQNEAGEIADPAAAAATPGSGAAEEGHGGTFPPPANEPSHHAVGIGVIDDEPDPSGDHHGHDEGRDTLTASAAQREGALSGDQEQRLPAMSQNNASEVDKVAGIVAQTRNDLAASEPERVPEVLRERLEQAGIDLPDAEIEELARQITTGDK
jgi:hypothetical protein